MTPKLKRAVPAKAYHGISCFLITGWNADECIKADCDCYIVPRALWERAEKALRKKGKK